MNRNNLTSEDVAWLFLIKQICGSLRLLGNGGIAERKSDGKYSQVWKHDFGDNSICLYEWEDQ